MRNIAILLFAGLAFVIMAHSSGPGAEQDKDRTGGPVADGFCSACHSGGNFGTAVKLTLLGEAGDTIQNYVTGTTYTMRVEVTGEGASGFGFQAVALGEDLASIGSYGNPASGTRITEVAGREYFEHNARSTTGMWEIDWTAPDESAGDIKFYFAGNAVDGNGGRSGDEPVHDSLIVASDQTSNVARLTDFSLSMGPIPADDHLRIQWSEVAQRARVEIASASGQLMHVQNIPPGTRALDVEVSEFPRGIYVLSLVSGQGFQAQKFLKN